MSVTSPKFTIKRQSVVGSEGLWTKMFDPPRLAPPTPELINLAALPLGGSLSPVVPRPNPVPSVMQAASPSMYSPGSPYTVNRTLMHGMTLPTWDGGVQTGSGASELNWYLFNDAWLRGTIVEPQSGQTQNASAAIYPAPTLRVPRGAVFHGATSAGGPPPHTIHWHGIEPTPMNDGVGHCSFELAGGTYIYQWQPNFIGTYFYHCHRNTMMHFEFGLAGFMLFSPPDAYFASIASVTDQANGIVTLNATPIGAGRDGKFRTAANLNGVPIGNGSSNGFPGYFPGDNVQGVNIPDDWAGDPFLKFPTHPHAFTVPYDVEALWMPDDRSSQWSLGAGGNAFATMPVAATTGGSNVIIGVNEGFHNNGTSLSPESGSAFFGFNDFNADYWFISGVPVPAVKGGTGAIPAGIIYPRELNSGILGSQVSIRANRGETVFVRCLNGAYNSTRTTFPVDVVIIEWDGRALGVPPLNQYTRAIPVPAGTPITESTARRWGVIFNVPVSHLPVNSFATIEFLDTRSTNRLTLEPGGGDPPLMTAQIPIEIA